MLKIFKRILYALAFSFPAYLIYLTLFTQFKPSDLTSERISILKDRPKNIEKDIVADLTKIGDKGGIATYSEEVMKYLIQNKPNYRWIIVHNGQYGNKTFTNFIHEYAEQNKNIILVNIKSKFGEFMKVFYFIEKSQIFKSLDESFSKWLSSKSNKFNDTFYRIKQLFLHGTIFVDRHCDLIFSLATPSYSYGYGIPQVSVIHDVIHIDKPEIVSYSSYLNHARAFSNNFNCSKKLISISYFTKDCILKYYNDINDDKIEVIRTQMASRLPNISNKQQQEALDKFKLEDGKYFVFASGFWSHKNHDKLVQAFAKIVDKINNDFKLVFMGANKNTSGNLMKTAKRAIQAVEQNNLQDRIVFTGYTTNEEFNSIMSSSLAVVNPSLYEGFGMPVAEAMLLRKPVICSNAASIPEVGGDAAIYFDPNDVNDMADKLYKVYSDNALRNDMIRKGDIQVTNFTNQESMLSNVCKLLDKVMEEVDEDEKYKIDWKFCSLK